MPWSRRRCPTSPAATRPRSASTTSPPSATSTVPDNFAKLTYRFNNGVPNQLTQRATPLDRAERQRLDLGLYVQDKWTINRLTLSGGLAVRLPSRATSRSRRWDPAPHVPNRNITFPKTDMANWKDIVPRLGGSYDLFGNGKTALKASHQQVRGGPGPAGHLRRHGQPGEPPGQHRHPHLDRRRPRLRGRLRPDQRAGAGPARVGRRFLRHRVRHELRPADAQPELRPGGARTAGARVPISGSSPPASSTS